MKTGISESGATARKHLTRWIAIIISTVLLGNFSFCEPALGPRAVVEQYCLLDAQGATYSSRSPGFNEIGRLLINEDEAAYDESEIVASYQVGEAMIRGQNASVPVTYSDLGVAPSEGKLEHRPSSETVEFQLTRVKGAWKIDGLRLIPHVSKTWILAQYRRDARIERKQGKVEPKLLDRIAEIGQW